MRNRQRMAFSHALPLVLAEDDHIGVASSFVDAFDYVADGFEPTCVSQPLCPSSSKMVAAAPASEANFEEASAATSATRLGLYKGGTSAGGVTCRPLSRALPDRGSQVRNRPAGGGRVRH